MSRILSFLILALILWSCPLPLDTRQDPWEEPGPGSFFFIQDLDGALGLLDPAKEKAFFHLGTLEAAPNHLLAYGSTLVVTNSLSGSLQSFRYNRSQGLTPEKRLFLGENKNPWMVAAAALPEFPGKAYVPCWLSSEVLVVDLENLTLTGDRIPTGPNPQAAALVETRLFVANVNFNSKSFQFGSGSLTVIDTLRDQVETTLELPGAKNPQGLIPFPDRQEIHVVCTGEQGANDGKVLVYHTETFQLLKTLEVGGSPSWSVGGRDDRRKAIYLSGIGGLQGYNYETGEVFGEPSESGTFLVKGNDNPDDLWSGALYQSAEDRIYLALSGQNRILRLAVTPEGWTQEKYWDTLNYPKGDFLPLW